MQFRVGNHTKRIDNRRDINPKGNNLHQHDLQVSVLCCQRRENHTKSDRHQCQNQHQQREKNNLPMNCQFGPRCSIIDVKRREDKQLDTKCQQVGCHSNKRHNDPRKIHLTKDVRICDKRVGCGTQATGEIPPNGNTEQVKQDWRQSVSRNIRNTAKHSHIHDHRQYRSNDKPQRTEDSLLIRCAEVTRNEKQKHIPIPPNLAPIQCQQSVTRRDDIIPICIVVLFHNTLMQNIPTIIFRCLGWSILYIFSSSKNHNFCV